jgi:hypothetical protein
MSGNNFAVLFDFRERWRPLANPHLRQIQRFVLPASVDFESPKFDQSDETVVTINCQAGPSDGKISLQETAVINSNYLHLDFDSNYQDYDFDDETGALTISGNSPKMGGDYRVIIQPGE